MGCSDLVPVCGIHNAALVPLAQSLLDAADIRYFIRNERVQELVGLGRVGTGYNVATGAPLVTVEPSHADEVTELLAKLDDPDAPPVEIGEAWSVPAAPEPTDSSRRSKASYWIAAALGVLVIAIAGNWLVSSPWVRGIFLGNTDVTLEAHIDSALWHELELGKARIAHLLSTRGIPVGAIETGTEPSIELNGIAHEHMGDVELVLEELFPDWSRELKGSRSWRVEMTPTVETRVFEEAVDAVRARLREDLGATVVGITELVPGSWQLQVRIPGTWDLTEVQDMFRAPAMLEIREIVTPKQPGLPQTWFAPDSQEAVLKQFGGRLPDDAEVIVQRDARGAHYWPVRKISVVVGCDLSDAFASWDEWGDPTIVFQLSHEAGRRLEASTRRMIGQRMAFVLRTPDSAEILSVPRIEGVIRDQGVLRGGFTLDEAHDLATRLRAGSRPLFLTPVDASTRKH